MLEPALTQRLETLWRMESPVLIARLARLLGGDVGRAEELAQDTWLAALERWPAQGMPDNPGAWLMTTARNRAIDVLRQHQRVAQQHAQWGEELHPAPLPAPDDSQALEDDLGDDLLRLMFVACHPVLPADARVALTLRLLGGLTTTEIARAFLQPEPTIAQRIVRAKRTLAQKQVPYEVPRAEAMPERLASVLEAIYLVFNEGYAASAGDDWMRPALCEEALRLARILAHRLPMPPVLGLLALMELQASRAAARTDAQGVPVLLDQQNRARWDWLQIERGQQVLARALAGQRAVLLGNAAQTIHPLGAQGFNLGLRDALTLAELLEDAGGDAGSNGLLQAYVARREEDRRQTVAFSGGLARLTSNPAPLLRPLRSLGLVAAQRASVQSMLVGGAMGFRGDVPRLCRGEAA